MTHICLIDDDQNILASLSLALKSEGYIISTFSDGLSGFDDIEIQSIEPKRLIAFLKAMEFKTLTEKKAKEFNISIDEIDSQKLELNFNPSEDIQKTEKTEENIKNFEYEKYSTIHNIEELIEWKEKILEKGFVAIDTETDSLNAIEANLIGFSMAINNNEACYVPLNHLEERPQIELSHALEILKEIMEDESILKILHNKKYDGLVLQKYNISITPYDDTMLISYSIGSGGIRHNLDALAKNYLSHNTMSFKEIAGTGKSQKLFNEIDINTATKYAAEDADVTLRLWKILKPKLTQDRLSSVYETIERPFDSADPSGTVDPLAQIFGMGALPTLGNCASMVTKLTAAGLGGFYEVEYDLGGNELTNAPKATAHIGIEYTADFTDSNIQVISRLDYYWQDAIFMISKVCFNR